MHHSGYTLLELFYTLCIYSILLILGIHTNYFKLFHSLIESMEIKQYLKTIRLSSLLKQQTILLCPMKNCQGHWFHSIYAHNSAINSIHSYPHLSLQTGRITFNHGKQLLITPNITHHQTNGTFTYKLPQSSIVNKLIINVLGRIRLMNTPQGS